MYYSSCCVPKALLLTTAAAQWSNLRRSLVVCDNDLRKFDCNLYIHEYAMYAIYVTGLIR